MYDISFSLNVESFSNSNSGHLKYTNIIGGLTNAASNSLQQN